MTLVLPVLCFVIAMLACGGLIALLIPHLQRAQVIDIPNARSLHVAPVPRGAGLAIAVVVIVIQLALSMSGRWSGLPALVTSLVAAGHFPGALLQGILIRRLCDHRRRL